MKAARIFRVLIIVVVFLVLGASVFVFLSFHSSLPSKKDTLQIPGLQAEVIVNWDRWGVPHIKAQNEPDLFLASGYVQARERLWQMELLRRVAQGRLSEILGKPGLKHDIKCRVLGIPVAIERDYQKLSPEMKELLAAFASGVNVFIQQIKWDWPPEFMILRIRPEPWEIKDTLSVKHLLALGLAADLTSEIARMNLIKRAGIEAVELLEPGLDFPPDSEIRLDYLRLGGVNQEFIQGSNNWVISGELTETGRPFLANDPHLGITVPPIWMEISLECPDYKVAGVTVPGVPLVIIGHNQRIAWGVTNSYADVQDIFVEKVDWDKESYFRQGEWKPFSFRTEVVKIRGEKNSQTLEIRWTDEGPLLNPHLLNSETPISLRWTIYEGDTTVTGLYLINKARNWNEFCAGARRFENPSQNFVYADIDGNIGYYLTGKIPIRKKEAAVYAYPGWREDSLWTGYLSEEQKPNQFNPTSGFIVTANNNIAPPDYSHYLGFDWLLPDRKLRIEELIKAQKKHSLESMIAIQNDVYSRRAERVKKVLNEIRLSEPEAEQARKLLIQWSGEVKEGMAPAIFEVFWAKLQKLTFYDDLSFYYQEAANYFRAKEAGLEKILDDPDSDWFDLIDTEQRESREEIIEKALLETMKELKKRFGQNQEKWDWAKMHSLNYQHLLGEKWFLGFLNSGTYPMIGDETTVKASLATNDWQTTIGQSCRFIVDLSNLDNSLMVLTSGESGHFMSPHYSDQIPLYLNSLYHQWAFSEEAVSKIKSRTVTMVPKK
ncbi:MAG: penicillin acylase family protein [Acidobacteriota bacterium]|nr:penicillin acylase family protein [Acidobacteriota bacterium]MDW3228699.1 penicillin acylase family protein [Acidobacteriota bacterium]MDY0231395.1 penicillin acylase family protein [Candidatus Saccharicenans sp.]